jgi:dolichyl-phosphate-mannose--protein O-mannosyl transferase
VGYGTRRFHPSRRYTTAFYLTMLIIVFSVAVAVCKHIPYYYRYLSDTDVVVFTQKQNIGLILVLLIIEIIAALWYSISFIPFGRKIVMQGFRSSGLCKPCFDAHDQSKAGGGTSAPTGGKGQFVKLDA